MRPHANIVFIDGEPFAIAKDRDVSLWRDIALPSEEGNPGQPMRVIVSDWSRGLGDSHGVVTGGVERAVLAYCGHAGRVFPGPAVSTVSLTLDEPVAAIVEVQDPARRLIALGGRYAKEINSSHAVTLTQDFGSGWSVKDAVEYRGAVAIAMGDGNRFWWRNTSGTYAQNTNGTDSAGDYRYADCFGLTSDGHLARGRGSLWSKCITDSFAVGAGSWSAENQVGLKNARILDLLDFQRWDYVLKQDGLYAFDDETIEMVNELPDMAAYPASFARWFTWYNRLLLCLPAGLYRYVQAGGARAVGLEENRLNLSFARDAFPTAGVAYGTWAYVAYYSPADDKTLIFAMRLAAEGDAAFSPFTFVYALDEFTGRCNAMAISDISGQPTVYFGRNADLGYFALSRNGLPVTYRTSGTQYVQWIVPSEAPFTRKYLRAVSVDTGGHHTGSAVQVRYSWDGSTWHDLGAAVTANGLATRYATPGSNDSGEKLWLRLELANASSASPVYVSGVAVALEERPVHTRGAVCSLRMRDFLVEGGAVSMKTAAEQLDFLRERIELGSCIITDPYGNTWRAAIAEAKGDGIIAPMWQPAEGTISIVLRELEYA